MKIGEQDPSFRNILRFMRSKDYVIYDAPYKLNIVGIRNAQTIPNKFDDDIVVFYKNDENSWEVHKYPATTDIGTYYLLNPFNANLGSAMLKEGQYVNAYARGIHYTYLALVEVGAVTVYRDYDRNATFDFNQKQSTGKYGINIHKAGANSQDVDTWSAGCQVFQKSADFNEFMEMTKRQADTYGNSFTYTLIDERAIQKRKRRILLLTGISLLLVGLGAFAFKKFKK
jgi:hypothetical protein